MRYLLALSFALAFAYLILGSTAHAAEFESGVHYAELPIPVETNAPEGAVEVVEVFSYACIHCYNFEPFVRAWKERQPDDVAFRRVPAVFNPVWEMLGQAYYAAEALGVLDAVHMPLFEAIHVHRMDIRDAELLGRIFRRYADTPAEEFSKVFRSFGVVSSARQARAQSQAYRISGVPSLIVAGKYRIETGMAGGLEQMLAVVDFLVEKERGAIAEAD